MIKVADSKYFHFAKEQIRTSLIQRDVNMYFDRGLWKNLAATGFFKLRASANPAAGESSQLLELISAFKDLGRGGLDIPLTVSAVAQAITVDLVRKFGNETQRVSYLENLVNGNYIGSICNSEAGAGTNIRGIRSNIQITGKQMGKMQIEKRGATNLSDADLMFCSAWKNEVDKKPSLEVFVLERSDAVQTHLVDKLAGFYTGLTGSALMQTENFNITNRQLGEGKLGFSILKHCFNLERIFITAVITGVLEGLVQEAMTFACATSPTGTRLADNQYIQDKIIEVFSTACKLSGMLSEITSHKGISSEDLVHFTPFLSVMKTTTITDAGNALLSFYEVFGFPSFTTSHVAQKVLRDHMAMRFLGGSKEQQKIILFDELSNAILGVGKEKSEKKNVEKSA
ncbi:MAG: hypothetical protein A4S09_09565 [Proteobacteria bacterium SG_bin7]|nr:MAG: hypothetical protein A4S09_09565 [Proteobacteria bacterium SG_bin7]